MAKYVQHKELWFDSRTPLEIRQKVSGWYVVCQHSSRFKFYYGDQETGRAWGDDYDEVGYIGRSTGAYRVPLVIFNANSNGGPELLTHCIVKVEPARKSPYNNEWMHYEHPFFHRTPEELLAKQQKFMLEALAR